MLRLAIGRPSWVRRISGSLPRFPTRITLFTLPAIAALHSKLLANCCAAAPSAGTRRRIAAAASARTIWDGPYTPDGRPDFAIPRQSRLSTYSIAGGIVPVLFSQPRAFGPDGIAVFAAAEPERPIRLPRRLAEILNKSLTCRARTSPASVAFRRRHFAVESAYDCITKGSARRSRLGLKTLRDQREADKNWGL